MSEKVTILTSKGPLLAKRWTAGGIDQYQRAKHFRVQVVDVADIAELSQLLRSLERTPHSCVIRGLPRGNVDLSSTTRDLDSFYEVPHHFLCLDVDDWNAADHGYDPTVEPEAAVRAFIEAALPPEFHHSSCHWQLSNSAGASGKGHLLKAHLWFWLERPYTEVELTAWVKALSLPVDHTVFRPVQVHYTSAPIIDEGVECPVTQRSGFIEGLLYEAVPLEIPQEVIAKAFAERVGATRKEMVDPTEKGGIVGAFCRAVPPERAIDEFLAGHFTWEGDDGRRLTWEHGGGAPGGAVVTDDGLHVYNSHATDPAGGRALNTFDLVRVHLFGDLDRGTPPETPAKERPSFVKMAELARSLPEVAADLVAQRPSAADEFDQYEDDPEDALAASKRLERDRQARVLAVNAREREIQAAIDEIRQVAVATELEHGVAPTLQVRDWTAAERERLANAIKDQYKALTSTNLAIATAREWLEPVYDGSATGFPDVNGDGRVLGTLGNVEALLQRHGITVRQDLMKKETDILIPGLDVLVDERSNTSFAEVLSRCNAVDMKIQPATLNGFLTAIAQRNPFNPALEWILSRKWDGVSRLQAFYDSVQSSKKQLKEMLMRRWALQAVAVLYNTGDTQARGVLTFQGPQYIGKSRWARGLAPPGMVKDGISVHPGNKDDVKIALSYWISELGELDATFRKADLSALKAFISRQTDSVRLPYAAKESTWPRRTVFFASVNDPEFLADQTGNSRYWVIPVDAIGSLADVDIQQLWAEVHKLFEAGDQHWLTSEEMEMLNAENEDHLIVSPIQEMVAEKFPWGEEGTGFVWMSTVTIGEEIELQHVNTADARAIVSAVRALNRRHYGCEGIDPVEKKVRGIKRFRVPQRRDDDWPDDPVGLPLPPAPGVVGVDRPDLRSSSCA